MTDKLIRLLLPSFFLLYLTMSYAGQSAPKPQEGVVINNPCKNTIYGIYKVDDPKIAVIIGNAVAVDKHILATHCKVALLYPDLITGVNEKSTFTEVIYTSPDKQLCLLTVLSRELHPAIMRPTKDVKLEEHVFSVGNPTGNKMVLTKGTVEAFQNADTMPIIESNAVTSPAAEGGGLFDKDYNLVGIIYLDPAHPGKTFALSTEAITDALQKIRK